MFYKTKLFWYINLLIEFVCLCINIFETDGEKFYFSPDD